MDINQLLSFASVVKNQSFTKAAAELFISQPTVSSHVKNLEKELDKQLIIRSTKSLVITDYGWELYDTARQILNIQNSLLAKWNDNTKIINRIGASTIPSTYILPDVLSAYTNKHTPLSFVIYQGDSSNIIENLKRGDCDIALTGMDINEPRIVSKPFFTDEMVLITPNNTHFAKYKRQDHQYMDILKSEPIIFREHGSASQKKAVELIDRLGIDIDSLNVLARVNEPEAIKNFVLHGFAAAIISKIAVENLINSGDVLCFDLPENVSKRNLYLMYNSTMIINSELRRFIEFLMNYYRNK